MIDDYFQSLLALIAESPVVRSSNLDFDRRGKFEGVIRGNLYFADDSLLHIREFVNTEDAVERFMYVYHYQKADGALVFRYDDTPHYPDLSSFPHHKHAGNETEVIAAESPDLKSVLAEIARIVAAE